MGRHSHPRAVWDGIANRWALTRPQSLWRQHSDRVNSELVRDWLPVDDIDNVLKTDLFDEAFGDGIVPLISSRTERVVGIDVSTEILNVLDKGIPKLSRVCADVSKLPFDSSSFQCVVSISTLDHFETRDDIRRSVLELHRVLRPNGTLIITLDNLFNPIIAMRACLPYGLLERLGLLPYPAGKTLTPTSLAAELAEAGFEVVESRAILHVPRVIAVRLAALYERYGNAARKQALLEALYRFECLGGLPSRYVTGYFSAFKAIKRETANV